MNIVGKNLGVISDVLGTACNYYPSIGDVIRNVNITITPIKLREQLQVDAIGHKCSIPRDRVTVMPGDGDVIEEIETGVTYSFIAGFDKTLVSWRATFDKDFN